MTKKVEEIIQTIIEELNDPQICSQRKRFLQDQLDIFIESSKIKNLSSFDVFCEVFPDAPECRIYDV